MLAHRSARLLVGLALVLSACSAGEGGAESPGDPVRFETEDGVSLVGEMRGEGERGVLLAHMFGSDRSAFAELGSLLARRGFRTLAFDFRGFGESGGEQDASRAPMDLLSAANALQDEGASTVAVIGASMGGTAALVAASRDEVMLEGVVTLSAPASFMGLRASAAVVRAVEEPKLFVAAQGDATAPGSAQEFFNAAAPPKRVEIVVGDAHGTALLTSPQAEIVRGLILGFLERTSPQ